MNWFPFLPSVSQADIEHISSLIRNAYIPGESLERQKALQQELFQVQKRKEAWGLIPILLENPDPNISFFGAHTAQVKIARDWDSFPKEYELELRDSLLQLCTRLVIAGKNRVAVRKLYVALCSLALRIVPGSPSKWPEWILRVVTTISACGAGAEYVLEFLEIVVEEISSADLVVTSKAQMQQSLTDGIPIMSRAVLSVFSQSTATESERHSAFKCLEAWITILPANDITNFIPLLIEQLNNEDTFTGASDVLEEILQSSSFSTGSGTAVLTEPLLAYLAQRGAAIIEQTLSEGFVSPISHSFCKLLVALGDHSVSYFAERLSETSVQVFLRLLFAYTSLPGYFGIDEEESEATLDFWYLLQEALWTLNLPTPPEPGRDVWTVAIALYTELVQALKRKVSWPPRKELATWPKDQKDRFQNYRRDVGDTLLNAYYVLRRELFKPLVEELIAILSTHTEGDGWESVEAILHCVTAVQEAVEIAENPYLEHIFGSEILGRLPTSGQDYVRRTAINLVGTYATWFSVNVDTRLLLGAVNYAVEGLGDPALCLPAANALRLLCDANRTQLSGHIGAFGQLHAQLPNIPDSEKTKILESISSVIQALPADQEIEPVDAIVSPVVSKLGEALASAHQLPDEARALAVLQIQALTGCAKGLTRSSDLLFSLDDSPAALKEWEVMNQARENPRMIRLRESIVMGIQGAMSLWAGDATTADALSDLFKSITALPADVTLLSLPPGPLLDFVCGALQQYPNSVWLSLASMLIHQLDPPAIISTRAMSISEANAIVLNALPAMLDPTLRFLRQKDVMEANPDVVQSFFNAIETVARHFAPLFFELPPGALDALAECTVHALTLQERYSLVSACSFITFFINRTVPTEPLALKGKAFIQAHGYAITRAVLCGIAGLAPSSTTPNLIELLATIIQRCFEDCRVWIPKILFSEQDFIPTKASDAAKETFAKTILASRSAKKTREAAQQFALVAKGLEGTSFGLAAVSM